MTTRILVADDSQTVLKAFHLALGTQDIEVVTALSLDQITAVLEASNRFDLIILDSSMDGFSGYELCSQLKLSGAVSGIPVYILASGQAPFDAAQASEAGVDGHFIKPFDSQELIDGIASAIEVRKSAGSGLLSLPDEAQALHAENLPAEPGPSGTDRGSATSGLQADALGVPEMEAQSADTSRISLSELAFEDDYGEYSVEPGSKVASLDAIAGGADSVDAVGSVELVAGVPDASETPPSDALQPFAAPTLPDSSEGTDATSTAATSSAGRPQLVTDEPPTSAWQRPPSQLPESEGIFGSADSADAKEPAGPLDAEGAEAFADAVAPFAPPPAPDSPKPPAGMPPLPPRPSLIPGMNPSALLPPTSLSTPASGVDLEPEIEHVPELAVPELAADDLLAAGGPATGSVEAAPDAGDGPDRGLFDVPTPPPQPSQPQLRKLTRTAVPPLSAREPLEQPEAVPDTAAADALAQASSDAEVTEARAELYAPLGSEASAEIEAGEAAGLPVAEAFEPDAFESEPFESEPFEPTPLDSGLLETGVPVEKSPAAEASAATSVIPASRPLAVPEVFETADEALPPPPDFDELAIPPLEPPSPEAIEMEYGSTDADADPSAILGGAGPLEEADSADTDAATSGSNLLHAAAPSQAGSSPDAPAAEAVSSASVLPDADSSSVVSSGVVSAGVDSAGTSFPGTESEPTLSSPKALGGAAGQLLDEKMAAFAARGPAYAAVAELSREVIEQVVWEVVPELAEIIVREHVEKLAGKK